MSRAPSHDITASDKATGTINNDDSAPVISAAVTIADASASEGDALAFTVTLDNAVPGGFTVTTSFTDGTATQGVDYNSTETMPLDFVGTAGETVLFTVPTTEDTDVEDNETFTISLSVSGTTHDITASDTATGTINNDDTAPDPYLGLNSASVQEGDSGTTTMTFTARLTDANGQTQASTKTITANYQVLSESNDTATAGKDYTATSGTITFAPGETSKTIDVSVMGDTEVEGNETFTVKWTGWENVWLISYTTIGTINNDDTAPNPTPTPDPVISATVTIADASASEGDALSFTVTLDNAVPNGLTVTPSYTNGTAASTDYTANTNALNFTGTAGETQTFTVATTEDTDVEANETFTVGLTASGTTHSVTASDTATGTILNDDSTPESTSMNAAAVTITNALADEGDALSFSVALNKAVPGGFTLTPSFTDGTAVQGSDYTANTAAITFSGTAGETQTFTVATVEDKTPETVENFTIAFTVSGTTHRVTVTNSAIAAIRDDDNTLVTATASATASSGNTITIKSPRDPVTRETGVPVRRPQADLGEHEPGDTLPHPANRLLRGSRLHPGRRGRRNLGFRVLHCQQWREELGLRVLLQQSQHLARRHRHPSSRLQDQRRPGGRGHRVLRFHAQVDDESRHRLGGHLGHPQRVPPQAEDPYR